ncbi:MAG: flavodoxin [Pseudomonadota bacterium]
MRRAAGDDDEAPHEQSALRIPTRSQLMTSMAGLPLAAGTPMSEAADSRIARPEKPVLVAYYSRSGNTRVIASLLSRLLGGTVFEIMPATPYPEDCLATIEQARKERDQGVEPALKNKAPDIADYATVFLGMPIWGETAPP